MINIKTKVSYVLKNTRILEYGLREDIKKKTADLVKIASFTLPPSPPT